MIYDNYETRYVTPPLLKKYRAQLLVRTHLERLQTNHECRNGAQAPGAARTCRTEITPISIS